MCSTRQQAEENKPIKRIIQPYATRLSEYNMTQEKKQTAYGDTMLPIEKRKILIDKLETMSTGQVLSILYQYYGNRNLLSEELYNFAVEDNLLEKLW